MNPTMIKVFDVKRSKTITTHFFDICLTSGNDCGTAKTLFTAIENKFDESSLPWNKCVGLSVDNTNTMICKHNSITSNALKKNPNIFIGGCPCHFAHIAPYHAHNCLSELLDVNIENLCIDLYCWFNKSSKRKGKLLEYFEFCNQEYKSILKHVSVSWLSLERYMDRILHKQPSLKEYFFSESFSDRILKDLMNFSEAHYLSQHYFSCQVQSNFSLILISYCKQMNNHSHVESING